MFNSEQANSVVSGGEQSKVGEWGSPSSRAAGSDLEELVAVKPERRRGCGGAGLAGAPGCRNGRCTGPAAGPRMAAGTRRLDPGGSGGEWEEGGATGRTLSHESCLKRLSITPSRPPLCPRLKHPGLKPNGPARLAQSPDHPRIQHSHPSSRPPPGPGPVLACLALPWSPAPLFVLALNSLPSLQYPLRPASPPSQVLPLLCPSPSWAPSSLG